MKFRFVFLIFIAALTVWLYPDWDKLRYPEYRRISENSEKPKEIFEQRLLANMAKKTTVPIRDLTDFKWDTVCMLGGYSHLREDMAWKKAYGKDLPELGNFPNVQEGSTSIIFIEDGSVVAVFNQSEPRIVKSLVSCASPKRALLKLISPITHQMPEWKNCKNNIGEDCQLEFHGAK